MRAAAEREIVDGFHGDDVIPPLSNAFYTALGRVTAHFAVLEGQVEFLVWSLLGRDQRLGQIITAEMSFRNTVSLLSSVFRHRIEDEALRTELEDILTGAMKVEERRNRVVHSQWAVGDTPETRVRLKKTAKKGKGIQHQLEHMTAAEIDLIATDASDVATGLLKFSWKLPAELVGRQEI